MKIIPTKFGRMRIIDSDKIVSHALEFYGEWAMDELNLIEKIITPGMHVMDIGAFIGTHSLAFASFIGPHGKVYAFEPRKEISEILEENVQLNDYSNIIVYRLGLGEKDVELRVPTLDLSNPQNFGGFSLVNEIDAAEALSVIHIRTADSLDIDKVDVIKIDVEGMEHEVLNGATALIEKNRPIIFCECNSVQAGNAILESMKGFRYEIFGFLSGAYNQENFNRQASNIFGNAKELTLLLLPCEKSAELLSTLAEYSLSAVRHLDDLVLLLLHKPQYAYEVLASTGTAGSLGLDFPSPAIHTREHQLELVMQQMRENAYKEADDLHKKIASLQNMLVETQKKASERVESLRAKTALLEDSIKELSQHADRADQSIDMLQRNLVMKERDLQESRELIGQRDQMITRLTTSKSWVLTKPIRWTGRVIRGDLQSAMDPFRRSFKAKHTYPGDPVVYAAQPAPNSAHYLDRSPIKRTHPVAVILPVYRGVEMTRRCIQAAMPGVVAVPMSHMVVINDGSPDAGMQEMLESLEKAQPGLITVLKNERNLGFVGTVNRGFASAKDCDAVLLNSDVMVPENWLARMIDEAYSRSDIGTVTPLSNNGTICSFPQFLQENPQPFDLDVNTIDAVFRQEMLSCIEAPTGVGFCMYIRRSCLDQIGFLNQDKFGRGYGEENDLCQRAKAAGWLNIITPNIYAYHEGGVSFSSEKQMLVERAMKILDEMHPNYHADIQAFIRSDPLKSARVARYVQLLSSLAIPKILHVSHGLGGGVTQHIEELAQEISGTAHLLITPTEDGNGVIISLGVSNFADKLQFGNQNNYQDVKELFKIIGCSLVHYHHLLNFDKNLIDAIDSLDVPHILTVHDFYLMNGNPTLTDETGKYSGFYDENQCNPLYPLPEGVTPSEWQSRFRNIIETSQLIIFPSNSTKSIFEQVYKVQNAAVVPHIESSLDVQRDPLPFEKKSVYTVGVLGAISREKGADLLEDLAESAAADKMPFEFRLIGYSYRPLRHIKSTGPYTQDSLRKLITENKVDAILFTARWPETYSYTLSQALDSGLPIIAPNIGAFTERLAGRQNTMLFKHLIEAENLAKKINDFFIFLGNEPPNDVPLRREVPLSSNFYSVEYCKFASLALASLPLLATRPYSISRDSIISGANQSSGWRQRALSLLWALYMNRATRWISIFLPFSFRRMVKRNLSRKPIHDINKIK